MDKFLIFIIVLLNLGYGTAAHAEESSKKLEALKTEIGILNVRQERLGSDVKALSSKNEKNEARISDLQSVNKSLALKVDSLHNKLLELIGNQKADKSELLNSIDQTNNELQSTANVISLRTLWCVGGLMALVIGITVVVFAFLKKFKSGSISIDNVRKAQEALQTAQSKMQEESIKLDDKLLELLDKQMSIVPKASMDGVQDHSLALKVADEIVRIELNMSRMDPSIKGYKQLAKAVERIKDNFKANGYEIVDMLGKPYNEGMKVTANFVVDEDLEEGKQIITGITKPQINYNGKMIQAAQITVSQNI